MCAVADLERQIDFTEFDSKTGRYLWASDGRFDFRIGSNAKERAALSAEDYCAHSTRVWLGGTVAEYTRLTGYVPVDRLKFLDCQKNATTNFLRAERREQIRKALGVAAIVVPALLLLAALWYRRPLWRKFRAVLSRANELGPK